MPFAFGIGDIRIGGRRGSRGLKHLERQSDFTALRGIGSGSSGLEPTALIAPIESSEADAKAAVKNFVDRRFMI